MNDRWIRDIFRGLSSERGRRLLHSYQDTLLRRQIRHAAADSPFYRRKFAEHGIDPASIHGIADLASLPFFTRPADLLADPYDFLSIPREDILYAMSSSGTTGNPKIVFLSREDWNVTIRTVANGFAMMGVTPADVAQILFCFGTPAWMTGNVLLGGLERLGAFCLPTGNSESVSKQIQSMRRFGSTMLLGTPSYLHRLTEEGSTLCNLRELGIRLIRLGAEPWSETLRATLKEAWGAEVYDSYGMMELASVGAAECKALSGMHLTPYLAVEVVDPATGRPLPRGQLGELVFTTLLRRGSPLLRYRSGDLGYLMPDEMCPCGELPTDRISRIVGRADDMFFLGSGENVFPMQIESALLKVNGLSDFQVVIEKDGYRDRLQVRAETANRVNGNDHHDHDHEHGFTQAIRQALYAGLPFLEYEIHSSQTVAPLEVQYLIPGTIHAESPVKLRRVVDRRSR
jgi:phenylacetate-CoA ligase